MLPEELLPTRNPRALRSFVHGRAAFRAYLDTRRSQALQAAETEFTQAEVADPAFSLATFYLAVTANELRDHDKAISKLKTLALRKVEFLPEVHLQLAYAYAKQYTDASFKSAESALNEARQAAKNTHRKEFLPLVDAYHVFLHSVIGAYGPEHERDDRLKKAVDLGSKLLREKAASKTKAPETVKHEIRNALGIAHTRQGQRAQDPAQKTKLWKLAEENLELALALAPNAVRVLQNRGTLRQLEGDYLVKTGQTKEANEKYRAALDEFSRAIEINALDQFPHFSSAILWAKLGDWSAAKKSYHMGMRQRGAVPVRKWDQLQQAIQKKEVNSLPAD